MPFYIKLFLINLFAIFLTDSKYASTSVFGTHVKVFWKNLFVSYKHKLEPNRTPNSHFWVWPNNK